MTRTLHTVPELVAYALFDVDPRVAKAQRPLHSFLVSLALFEAESPLDDAQLHAAVIDLLPTDATVTGDETSAAVVLSLDLKLIERDADGRLSLTNPRRQQLQAARDRLDNQRRAFHEHMRASAQSKGGELTEDELEVLYSALEDRLQSLLQIQSSAVAAAWSSDGDGFDAGLQALNAQQHLAEVANALAPGGAAPNKLKRTVISQGLEDGMRTLPSDGKEYLAALYQRTVAFALLRQDPTVRRVKRQLASKRIAYLDANVVLAAMFDDDQEHELATQVMQITSLLGAELRVTRFTVNELSAKIQDASRWMARYRGKNDLRGVVDDVVIRSFHKATRDLPTLKWGAFIGGFDPPDAWLAERGIAIEDDDLCAASENDGRLGDVSIAIGRHRRYASPGVIRTDALNLIHVDRRRKELHPDEMGNRVWLVTLDRSLARAERSLVDGSHLGSGVSRLAQMWVDLLSPCVPPDGANGLPDYVAHLVQSQFGLLAEDPMFVDKGFLLTLTRSRFKVSEVLGASPDRARQILTRLQQDEELAELVTEPEVEDDDWNDQLAKAVTRALAEIEDSPERLSELEDHREARMAAERRADQERRGRVQVVRELAEARGEVQDMQREAEELRAQRERSWWRRLLRRT